MTIWCHVHEVWITWIPPQCSYDRGIALRVVMTFVPPLYYSAEHLLLVLERGGTAVYRDNLPRAGCRL
jgi:hypothetical protein